MAYPFTAFPTLRTFIERALSQGCEEGLLTDCLVGPRGPVTIRYLVAPGEDGAIAILPEMDDDERLTPTVISQLVRVLRVRGFEHCIIDGDGPGPLS